MAKYTTQQVFPCNASQPVVIAAQVGTGSVTIEKPVGTAWVVADTMSADGANAYWMGNGTVRITPTGTAAYEVS